MKGFKAALSTKVCVGCGLPFAWRKRWRRCWDQVLYCSEKCRRSPRQRHVANDIACDNPGRTNAESAG
ncbi:MAG TPA: DUF2256 domain-containing protein [Candidatus Hydrogenedentes bacterium]|nr:DUF2256 domain-containing protein [Candidatus Hydrogenedentota bacterium]HRK35037.1 DUF2256 domain-containing protein [Candidatus Hydrogenedentota bacterium]